MSKPKLRFPEFTDEWHTHTLGTAFDVRDGTHESPQYLESGKPLITSKNLRSNGSLDLDQVSYISEEDFRSINKRSGVDVGDILFGMIGTIGNPVRVTSNDFAIKNVALIKPKDYPTEYLIHYLNSPAIKRQFYEKNAGGTQKFIALGDIRRLIISLPQKPEQQKIADFLTAIDKKIEMIDKKGKLLKRYKKGVMQKIFTQQIRFKDENGKNYPAWENRRMANVFTEITDKVGDSKVETYSITAGKGFVSQTSKFGRDISGSQNRNYTLLNEDNFSYNKGNSKTYTYGCVYLNKEGRPIAVPNVFISFKLKDENMIPDFFARLFENHYLDRYLRQIISSGARMDGLLNVGKSDFFDIRIPIPDSHEQQKVADFLSAIDDKIKAEEIRLDNTQKFKKALLQRMFL